METLVTPEQLQERWGVSKKWIYARTYGSTPELPHIKLGGLLRFRESDLAAYLAKLDRGARAAAGSSRRPQ